MGVVVTDAMDEQKTESGLPLEDNVRSPYVSERPYEAIVEGSEPGSGGETVEPGEEGPRARGFHNGGWSFDESRGMLQEGIPDVGSEHGPDRSDRT